MEQAMLAFLANALWQVPLIALGAAFLLRLVMLPPAWEHRLWASFLIVSLTLPLGIPSLPALPLADMAAPSMPVRQAAPASRAQSLGSLRPAGVPDTSQQISRPHFVLARGTALTLFMLELALIALGSTRLVLNLFAIRGLRIRSRRHLLAPALHRRIVSFSTAHRIEPPAILMSTEVSSPVTVGLFKPAVLLPSAFEDYSESEAASALLHECAHIVRKDFGLNLLWQLLLLPLSWNPMALIIRRGMSNSREMDCDRLAAAAFDDKATYARSLVSIARRMLDTRLELHGAQALFGARLERRVAVVLSGGEADQPQLRRLAGFGVVLPLLMALLVTIHVTPSIALPQAVFRAAALAFPAPGKLITDAGGEAQRRPWLKPEPSRRNELTAPRVTAANESNVSSAGGLSEGLPAQRMTETDRASLAGNGIGDGEIATFASAGYGNLTANQLIELHYNGIVGRFVSRLSAAGFPVFSTNELMELRYNGVTADEAVALARIGRSSLSAADLVMLHYRGVTPQFAHRLASLNYAGLSADAILRLRDRGIGRTLSDPGG